jgi:PAS domain-containing protein
VAHGHEERITRFVRDDAMAPALRVPGLLSFQPAVRDTSAGRELVVASTWNGFEDLTAAGRGLDAPLTMPGAEDMLGDGHAEHYELVIGEARAMPLHTAKLRLIRIPILANAEASYYEAVRRWSDRLLDENGLVAFTLGRRVVGRQDEIAAVMVWQDEAALHEVTGGEPTKPMGRDELSQFWAADPAIEHFDALTVTEPTANAPAILLADDTRRYVHATPAAARLTGRPLARLLTMRVEDVAPAARRREIADGWDEFVSVGSASGPFVLERPDGTEVEIQFAAKANAPWPGSHASVLVARDAGYRRAVDGGSDVERDDDGDLDVDRALVSAGLVARYARS